MKRGTAAAAAIVVIANGYVLFHASRNRWDPADADLTLTRRELSRPLPSSTDDDSEVALAIRWTNARIPASQQLPSLSLPSLSLPTQVTPQVFDEKALAGLGFDTSMAPGDARASDFYRRQRSRRAFVALEYNGPAWAKWIDGLDKRATQDPSRLVLIDTARDAEQLRARHPDRASVIVVPVSIAIWAQGSHVDVHGEKVPARLEGTIRDFPASIHVPLPFSEQLRKAAPGADYRVHLRYGRSHEPWVVGVETPVSGPPR